MNFEFLSTLSESADWKILKQQLLSHHITNYHNSFKRLNHYDIVYVLVNENGEPLSQREHAQEPDSFLVFTKPNLVRRMSESFSLDKLEHMNHKNVEGIQNLDQYQLKMMMLGELIDFLKAKPGATPIKINPVCTTLPGSDNPFLLCEEVLFAPALDPFTKKLLLTDPDDAKALLAIDSRDQKRLGMELVFYMITSQSVGQEDESDKKQNIKEKIDELAFIAPRVPIRQGSGTFLIVVVGLEDEIDELAFVRDYKTFDEYSNVLFVTSSLRLLTGELSEIHYNGDSIDTIFEPMIAWQKKAP